MADDTGNTSDTARRFEIFVPSPKARINLGAPNKDSTGPFGYTGLSLQSDVHLFIDANKHTLFQTGQNYCGQVGGKWLQYSNADMVLSSTANVNVSADKKIVIASGAGQGQITAIDHGTTPRAVPYNALELHYRTDRLQSSLFEFFHGRRDRDEYTGKLAAVLKFGGASTEYFDGSGKASGQAQKVAALAGGFAWTSGDSLRELYPVASKRQTNKFDDPVTDPGDPIALLDPFVHKKLLGGDKMAKNLKWGFSGYVSRFDPYSLTNPDKLTNPLAKGLAGFRNLLAKMRRFADVCTKYANLLTDNFLMKRAQAAMAAVDNLSKATTAAYNMVDLTFGAFIPGGGDGMLAALQDEKASGIDARIGGATGLQEAGQSARESVAGKKASIQSGRGAFDLSGATTLTIEWGNSLASSVTIDLTQGRPATGAQLPITIASDALLALPVRARIDLATIDAASGAAVVPEWIHEAEIVHWIAEELAVSFGALAPAVRANTDVRPPAATVRTLLSAPATIGAKTRLFTEREPPPGTAINPLTFQPLVPWTPRTATLTLGAFVTLAVQRPVYTFRLSVDGAAVTVSVDTNATGLDVTNGVQAQSAVYTALTTAIGSTATITPLSSGATTIQSLRTGATSHIAVLDGAEALLGGLGLDVGRESRGMDAIAGLGTEDLASVSAQRIAQLIGSHSKLTVTTSGGTLTLKSGHAPQAGAPSQVKVSGPVADVLFEKTKENTVTVEDTGDTAQDFAEADAEYKTLMSWNHELQKLPEDTRNLTRPIRNAVNDAVAAMSSLEKAVESVVEFVGGDLKGLPSPPEAIGLIADQGITLGTRDRIVGVGGKGVIFIADGGSGEEDHNKFIPKVEQFVNLALSWDPIDRKLSEMMAAPSKEKKRTKSLGFRVLSDSHVDLFGTHVAQLMALGRGKLGAPGTDGKSIIGTGVARVAGSYAAEVAGYRKVVVSARNRGDDDKTGGRVEIAGQTIAIGGMNIDGDVTDFAADAKDAPTFGVHALDVDSFAGAEHLSDDEKDSLKKDFATYAWPDALRDGGTKGHPNTKRVFVHAEKETVIQVGTFLVRVADGEGVMVGTRKPNAKALENEVDMDQPFLIVRAQTVLVSQKDGGATIHLEDGSVTIQEKDNGATVTLANGEATIVAGSGGSKGTVKLSSSGVEVKKGSNSLKLLDSGVQAQGSQIKWG